MDAERPEDPGDPSPEAPGPAAPATDDTPADPVAGIFRPVRPSEPIPTPNKRLLLAAGLGVLAMMVLALVVAGRQGVVTLPEIGTAQRADAPATTASTSFLVNRVDSEEVVIDTPLTSSTSAAPRIEFTPIEIQRTFPPPRVVTAGGRIELWGTVASEEGARALSEHLEQAFGAELVSSQLVIDPRAPSVTTILLRLVDPPPFRIQSSELTSEIVPTLDGVVALLEQDRRLTVTVEGHADELGDVIEDQELSEHRAQAVAGHLVGAGIEAGRVAVVGQGSTQPITDGSTPEQRQRNRRIDLAISGLR